MDFIAIQRVSLCLAYCLIGAKYRPRVMGANQIDRKTLNNGDADAVGRHTQHALSERVTWSILQETKNTIHKLWTFHDKQMPCSGYDLNRMLLASLAARVWQQSKGWRELLSHQRADIRALQFRRVRNR